MSDESSAVGARVLIAEDEKHLAVLLEHFLAGRGHQVTVVHDGRAALEALGAGSFDVALLDVQMPGLDGLAVLRAAQELPLPPQVVVMTGNGTVDTALSAMRDGAYDYVAKPYRMAEVDLLVRRAAERRSLECDRVAHESAPGETAIVTGWAPLAAIVRRVTDAAPTLRAMLVRGEPGTGRTTLARHAHRAAGGGPFVEIDGTLSGERHSPMMSTRIAAAAGGTLYVRAVDVLAVDAQRLLGRALGAMANLRLIAATAAAPGAVDLDASLREHLASLEAALPPLRERVGDVALLAAAFVRRYGGAAGPALGDAARERLERHPWPGNVAELRLVMEGAVARAAGADTVAPQHLGLDSAPRP